MMSQEVLSKNKTDQLRVLIEEFIQKRLTDKLDKISSDDTVKRLKAIEEYKPINWLISAAKRVSQIQMVTHVIKYQNSDAKGTSICLDEEFQTDNSFVSTKSIKPKNRYYDVTGNAASLDVYKFLQLKYENFTLLELIFQDDSSLFAAFPGCESQKTEWFNAFKSIKNTTSVLATHPLAKQLYFPIGSRNESIEYHVLAPLFPSSLVHTLHQCINQRYGEATILARKSRKGNKPYPHGYRDYPNLSIQKFGGSKPQNISQLNTERGGKIYLLPCLPPQWIANNLKPPMTSIFRKQFKSQVQGLIKKLRNHLQKNKDHNNSDIRSVRGDLVRRICDAFINYGAKIQSLSAGWSAQKNCKLSDAQKFWLDPGRARLDEEWNEKRRTTDWQTDLAENFARWLNATLKTKDLDFGDEPYREWKKLLKKELSLIKEVI